MPGGIAGISGWKDSGEKNPLKNSFFDDWLVKQIDKGISESQDFRESSSGFFHPSSLGKTCDRLLYCNYHDLIPQEPVEPQIRRMFDHGNVTETRYEKYFSNMKILRGREVRARLDSPPISGRADFKLELPEIGIVLIELKTIKDENFKKLTVPQQDHAVQLQCYLNILEIPQGFVIYENKNDQNIKAFLVKQSDSHWEEITNRCFRIMEMKEIPSKKSLEKYHPKWCDCLKVKDARFEATT